MRIAGCLIGLVGIQSVLVRAEMDCYPVNYDDSFQRPRCESALTRNPNDYGSYLCDLTTGKRKMVLIDPEHYKKPKDLSAAIQRVFTKGEVPVLVKVATGSQEKVQGCPFHLLGEVQVPESVSLPPAGNQAHT